MKIGILTFYRTTNYGAVLQAYALQKVLQTMGHESEIIDYRNMNIYSYSDPRFFRGLPLKTRIGKLLRYPYNIAVFNLFYAFWDKYIDLSLVCTTLEELRTIEDCYDVVICGSDQVWNPKAIFQDFNAFLLGTTDCRKIAYAASAGNILLWEPYLKTYWKLLHRFDAISVRESDMQKPTEHLSQKKVQVVLDPTLLLEQKDWYEIENKEMTSRLPQDGYILVYYLGKNSAVIQATKDLKKTTGVPVVSLGRKIQGIVSFRPITGPSEFLTLFHHASYILTNSFHGTCFSIQYQKPFLVMGNGAYNSRMNTLLDTFGIRSRMMANDGLSISEKMEMPIDWSKVKKRHNGKRYSSLAFLHKHLKVGEKSEM